MKRRKQKHKRFMSWLLAMLLVLNVLLPATTVRANEPETSQEVTSIINDESDTTHTDETNQETASESENTGDQQESLNEETQTPSEDENEQGSEESEAANENGEQGSEESEASNEGSEQGSEESESSNEGSEQGSEESGTTDEDNEQSSEESEAENENNENTTGETDGQQAVDPVSPAPQISQLQFELLADENVEEKLDYEASVTVDGTVFEPDTTLEINDGEIIDIEFHFTKIPVSFDGIGDIVKPGDKAEILIGTGLKAVSGKIPLIVEGTSIKIGDAELKEENGQVIAYIEFDWDWDEINKNAYNLEAGFKVGLKYDKDNAGSGNNDEKIITILDRDYFVKEPIEFKLTKKGTPSIAEKAVIWEVTIESTPDGSDLGGFKFSDDLSTVGKYLADSFKVGGQDMTPDGESTEYSLVYTFPEGQTAPQTIQFSTEIPEHQFNSNAEETIANQAGLRATASEATKSNKAEVKLPGKRWITKNGVPNKDFGSYDPDDRVGREITWTIVANEEGFPLENVTIKDVLGPSSGSKVQTVKSVIYTIGNTTVELDAAQLAKFNSAGGSLSYKENDPNSVYVEEFKNLNDKVTVTIVTSIPDDPDGVFEVTNYTNKATITWKGNGTGAGTGNVTVGIGYPSLQKSGTQKSDRKIEWTVNFNPRNQGSGFTGDLKIYDLLVHGNTEIDDLTQLDGWPSGSPATIPQRMNQKFAGWITPAPISSYNHIELKNSNGETLADLLIVSVKHDENTTFKFQSQVTNHEIYAGNGTEDVLNTAALYNGTTRLAAATGTVKYNSNILRKGILSFDSNEDPSKAGNSSNGFNHETRTAIFRLDINNDVLDFAQLSGGNITVTDTLPAGWVFDRTFNNNKGYKIFEGIDLNTEAAPDMTAAFDPDSDSASKALFTFANLNKHYVILVQAKLTEEAYENLLKSNAGTVTVDNQVKLFIENWNLTTSTVKQSVTVKTRLLDKNIITYPSDSSRSLTWQVKYQPFDIKLKELEDYKDVEIIDTFQEGLELPISNTGQPIWENITITKMEMGANGVYQDQTGENATLNPQDHITYDAATRTLTFKVPDSNQAYRFTYVTYITIDKGKVKNSVTLKGSKENLTDTEVEYGVEYKHGWANIHLGGHIKITKIDGFSQETLKGAEFSLISEENGNVIRLGETDESGIYTISAIPPGTYTLTETNPPAGGYAPALKTYRVVVTKNGNSVTTVIDGSETNEITVENFKSDDFGKLTFKKTVAGKDGETDRAFNFKVTLSAEGTYNYIGTGIPNGTIANGDIISLKHGQGITIYGLPKDTEYSITEEDYSSFGYTKTVTGNPNGKIIADSSTEGETYEVVFTNTRTLPGSLVISKTVLGTGADRTKKFEFTVTFNADGRYPYSGPGVPEGATIASGEKITLADGESATITGLPDGTAYKVTEADYSSQRYTTVSTNAEGTIETKSSVTAAFTNTYRRRSSGGGGGGNPSGPRPGNPLVTIEGNVPTGNIGGTQEEPEELVNIEGDIPLAGLPKTGDSMFGVHAALILFIFSAGMGIFAFSILLRKQEEE
ncbi:DUF7601 domain-containing protein [Lacrimispora sp.]|uniref:DUF7601 domain-containing protein n=1 Tax=Lacrimispora sp. TaxID=2719234 RepID=UPI002FDB1656